MIQLFKYTKDVQIPDADYVFDKTDKLMDLINLLTPKFNGNWEIIIIDPKIKYVKGLLENKTIPEWITISIYLVSKKLDMIILEYPSYSPKDKTKKDLFAEMLTSLDHIIDEHAKNLLFKAMSNNMLELQKTLIKLDSECTSEKITVKQVQGAVNYTKPVYASEVINAFILRDTRRWDLYQKLVKEVGMEIAYYACYKQVKELLHSKEKYLHNEDVKQFIVKRIGAPIICYAYVLFINSTNHNQLYGLLYALDNRNEEMLAAVTNGGIT